MRRRASAVAAAIAVGLLLCRPALAGDTMVEACIKAAAGAHGVPPGVLVLLLEVEGGRLGAVSANTNQTVDIGPMQINTIWVDKIAQRWGVSRDAAYVALRDSFCANVEAGAWILKQALDESPGDLWNGVAFYHSHNAIHKRAYLKMVYERAQKLRQRAMADLSGAPR